MRDDERQRQFEVSNGGTVIANEALDGALIAWASGLDKVARIDRRTIYGNPFEMPKDGDRDAVCNAYGLYLKHKPSIRKSLPSLNGKVLICHCYPARCHGLSILEAMGA
jgi:Domain of unknown function (DUF4326)